MTISTKLTAFKYRRPRSRVLRSALLCHARLWTKACSAHAGREGCTASSHPAPTRAVGIWFMKWLPSRHEKLLGSSPALRSVEQMDGCWKMGFLKRDAAGSGIHTQDCLSCLVLSQAQKEYVYMFCRKCIGSVMVREGSVSLRNEVFFKTNVECTSLQEGSEIMPGNWKLCNGCKKSSNYSRLSLPPFPQCARGTALSRSSTTVRCLLMNPLLSEHIQTPSILPPGSRGRESAKRHRFNCHFSLPLVRSKGLQAAWVLSTASGCSILSHNCITQPFCTLKPNWLVKKQTSWS